MKSLEDITKNKEVVFGLIKGRHDLPVNEFLIDGDVKDPFDYEFMMESYTEKLADIEDGKTVNVIVTGLTSATTTLIRFAMLNWMPLTLWHFDFNTKSYVPQVIISQQDAAVAKNDYGMTAGW